MGKKRIISQIAKKIYFLLKNEWKINSLYYNKVLVILERIMTADTVIRRATLDDIFAITEIYNQTVGVAHANFEPVSVASRQAWFCEHGEHRPIFVMTDDNDKVLAWLSLSDYLPRPAYHLSVEVSLYVDRKHTGKGLGAKLLSYGCVWAKDNGIINVIALIFGHNIPSISLFQKQGFEQWGVLPKVCLSQGRLADVVILGKKVGNAF